MSFARHIFPVRFDPMLLTERLIPLVETQFTQIESYPGLEQRTDGYRRDRIGGDRWRMVYGGIFEPLVRRADYATNADDRRIVRSILRAWRGELTDRYLSYGLVRLRDRESFESVDACYDHITRNAWGGDPMQAGCIEYIHRSIPRSSLPLFGDNVQATMTYGQYFSAMLSWDDSNLTALQSEMCRQLDRMAPADGGERALPILYRAVHRFIRRAQGLAGDRPSVYRAIAHGA